MWTADAALADTVVVWTEGEKAAAALSGHLTMQGRTDYVAVSTRGGADSVGLADWTPLEADEYVIWPDADTAGLDAVEKLADAILRAHPDAILRVVDTAGLPDGFDAADVDAETAIMLIEAAAPYELQELPDTPHSAAEAIGGQTDFSLTPLGDARRLLDYAASDLLPVRDSVGRHTLLVDNGHGVWLRDHDRLETLIIDSAKSWQSDSTARALRGDGTPAAANDVHRYIMRLARPTGRRECLETVGVAIELHLSAGTWPRGLQLRVADSDLDADTRFIGAQNGVIDLDTGRLLSHCAGRSKYVTRALPDDYDPDARHPDIDRVLKRTDAYTLDALGFALRGRPSRRWYLLLGPPNGGKSVLLNAARSALGSTSDGGYGFALTPTALIRDRVSAGNSHSAHLVDFPVGRIATASDIPGDGRLDTSMIKAVTGMDGMTARDVGQRSTGTHLPRATMFVSMNPTDVSRINMSDHALVDRLRVLDYAPIPASERDPGMLERVTWPGQRQAMLAALVDAAARNSVPPPDTPTVSASTIAMRDAALGDAGVWMLGALVNDQQGRVLTSQIWDAARIEADDIDEEKAFGRGRRSLMQLCAALWGLPPAKTMRVEGVKGRGWSGVRMRTAADRGDIEDAAIEPLASMPSADLTSMRDRANKILDTRENEPLPGQAALEAPPELEEPDDGAADTTYCRQHDRLHTPAAGCLECRAAATTAPLGLTAEISRRPH